MATETSPTSRKIDPEKFESGSATPPLKTDQENREEFSHTRSNLKAQLLKETADKIRQERTQTEQIESDRTEQMQAQIYDAEKEFEAHSHGWSAEEKEKYFDKIKKLRATLDERKKSQPEEPQPKPEKPQKKDNEHPVLPEEKAEPVKPELGKDTEIDRIPENFTDNKILILEEIDDNGKPIIEKGSPVAVVGELINKPIRAGRSVELGAGNTSNVTKIEKIGDQFIIYTLDSRYLFDPAKSIKPIDLQKSGNKNSIRKDDSSNIETNLAEPETVTREKTDEIQQEVAQTKEEPPAVVEKAEQPKVEELKRELPNLENDFLKLIYEHVDKKEQNKLLELGQKVRKLWHKGWWARLGVGGVFAVLGIVNPAFLLPRLGWQGITGMVGRTLGAEALWSKMEAARFTKKEGKTWESYRKAGKIFLKTLWEKKSLKRKEWFGLASATKESREKLVEVGHIDSKEDLNTQLDKLTNESMNDAEKQEIKLKEVKRRITGIAEIARRQGIKLEEVAGAQKSIGILLETFMDLNELVQEKRTGKLTDEFRVQAGQYHEGIKKQVLESLVNQQQQEWQELLSSAEKEENKRAIKRWLGSAAIGIVTGLLTFGVGKIFSLGEHKEAIGAAAVSGTAAKEVTKEKVSIFVQEAAQNGELKATIPHSVFGGNIKIVENVNHQVVAQIDGKEYPYVVENGKHFIYTRIDTDFDGKPDGNSFVKIDMDNGFGVDKEGHVVQAMDVSKKLAGIHADGIIARKGAILNDANGNMINGQIWLEEDGSYHASVIGQLEKEQLKLNPEGAIFAHDPKLPDDLRKIPGASEIFDNKYELEYLSGTPKNVAEQFTHLTQQGNITPDAIVKFMADNQIDPAKTDFNVLEQFTKNPGFEHLESGVSFSKACETYIQEHFVNHMGSRIISGEDKLRLINLLKSNKALMNNNIFNPLITSNDHLSMWYDKGKETLYLIDTQKDSYDLSGTGGIYRFPKEALDLIKGMDTNHILDKVLK